MRDKHGRSIEYLRLSVTERCTLKCAYCNAAAGLAPKEHELQPEAFERIARVMAGLGINKIRVTGGEPLLRNDICDIIDRLSTINGIDEIAVTTNAQQLRGKAAKLKKAGVSRLNISLDSLDEEKYAEITGGVLHKVLDGIDEALRAGMHPIKVNAVLMRGINDAEIDSFIRLATDMPLDVRFIELMPMGGDADSSHRITTDEILAARPWLQPLPPRYPSQPSSDYTMPGLRGRVGFISPISHTFCDKCNRVRVMSDGMLRPCLGNKNEISLLAALERGDDALREVIHRAIYEKPACHGFNNAAFEPGKTMSMIGG